MNLKNMALHLCTCTWIEIMTGAGITLYLLYQNSYTLAALTAAVFAPLIGFHFAIDRLSKDKGSWGPSSSIVRIRSATRSKDKIVY